MPRSRAYPQCLYWSSHTTAGFLDRSVASRLVEKPGVAAYIETFRTIFPEGADYEHDRLDRRVELAPEQREVEPKNADSHLAFIAAGLRTCVTYANRPGEPVCFVDLDGVNAGRPRCRHTRVIGFHREDVVARHQIQVPVSNHPVDSINLKDPKLGIGEELADFVRRQGVPKGRLRLSLHAGERHAGPHGERVRDAADAARPARGAARSAPVRHREGAPRDRRPARGSRPRRSATPSTTWCG